MNDQWNDPSQNNDWFMKRSRGHRTYCKHGVRWR